MRVKTTIVIVGVAILAASTFSVWSHFATKQTVQSVVIQDKERIVSGKESKYLVFTDRETFENVDSILALKFNSSDVYGRINKGATCDFVVTGFRVPLFSMYRNILRANCR
jgi:translation elongation factor P/translation initiation factor 5A